MSGKKDCKYCDKDGLLWLPLLYSIICAYDPDAISALPKIDGKLGKGVTDLALTQSKYAVRLLRSGYLYVLSERAGIKSWSAYMVLEDAYLYSFPPAFPPQITPQFSCDPGTCGINASMVAIPEAANVKKIWALFTPSPLTQAKLNDYRKNADTYASEGKMQTFSPADWLKEAKAQPHSLTAPELLTTVAEYVLFTQHASVVFKKGLVQENWNPDKKVQPVSWDSVSRSSDTETKYLPKSPLGHALADQLFPVTKFAHCEGIPNEKGEYSDRLGALQAYINKNNYAAFALHDPIGITQTLNNFRNAAFNKVEAFLDRTDKYQVSNQRKHTIFEKIQELRVGFENGMINDADQLVEANDMIRRSYKEPTFPDDTLEMKAQKSTVQTARGKYISHPSREEWENAHPAIVAELDAAYEKEGQTLPEKAKVDAKNAWQKKYLPKLDTAEMKAFIDSLDKVIDSANKLAATRADDHLKWVTSKQLVNAFEAYDTCSGTSGHDFEGESASCTFGMVGVPKAANQIEKWLNDLKIDRANIYMRGHYMNQAEIEQAAIEAMPQIVQQAEAVSDVTEMEDEKVLSTVQKIIGGFKKIDSAYDEWVRNGAQKTSKGFKTAWDAKIFAKTSEMTRFIFRQGIGGVDKRMAAVVSVAAYARIGWFAKDIGYKEYMLDFRKGLKQSGDLISGKRRGTKKEQSALFEKRYKRLKEKEGPASQMAVKESVRRMESEKLEVIDEARLKLKQKLSMSHAEVMEAHARIARNKELKIKEAVDLNTNNYHQVRMGYVMAVLESIALYNHSQHFEKNGRGWAMLVGSASSLLSITCDILYAWTKASREQVLLKADKLNVIGEAGKRYGVAAGLDIERGGWKVSAGVMGTFAGIASVALDAMNLLDEKHGKKREFLMTIYAARGGAMLVSTGYGAVAAFSYAGPTLEFAAKHVSKAGFLTKWAGVATALGKERVALLLKVARFNTAGLIITGVELAYHGIVLFVLDNALEEWCKHSTFRQKKLPGFYENPNKATREVIERQVKQKGTLAVLGYYDTLEQELKALDAAYKEVLGS